MLIGDFQDLVLAKYDYQNIESKKADRREILVQADAILGQLFAAGNYSATLVQDKWQFNIGNDLKDLPGILYISKVATVLCNEQRNRFWSILPGEVRTFKNKSGIRIIHGIQTNEANEGANINWQSDRTDFVEQKTGAGVAYGLLESAQLAGGIGYEIEMVSGTPGVVYYNNFPDGLYPSVLITYLPRLWNGGLSEDDMMPMDDTFAKFLIDETFAAFVPQRMYSRDKNEGM